MADGWKRQFGDRLTSAQSAIRKIRPGARVFIGSACGEPRHLVRALVEHGGALADTELVHVLTLGVAPYTDPQYAARFRANAFFIGNSVREAVNEARADYTPIFLSQVPELFRSGRAAIGVALVMVSPPDDHGFCSLGVSVDITKAAVESAQLVIAQVNEAMPRTHGDSFIHLSDIDHLVEYTEPLQEWPVMAEADESTERIATYIARLVPDGATMQMGIGRLPDAVLSLLTDKNDLGIHTEMFSDGVMKLAQSGVITGRRKTHLPGKIVGSFAAGSHELFAFIDNNPQFEMHPSDYTNDPFIISRHEDMVAINSAIEVDLTGQVCADSIGEYFYSGIGGHADFTRGAALARRGKPIIALPSTVETIDGVRSRIAVKLQDGAGVATIRGDTHYVVTEYGVAHLHGKTLRERAMSLISIAHPDFRGELLQAAKGRHLVYVDQIIPEADNVYPTEYEQAAELKDGSHVLVRPIRPADESMMREMFYSLSPETIQLRFHGNVRAMPHEQLQTLCCVDYDEDMAVVAVANLGGNEILVGVARYVSDPSRDHAEVAFAVRDEWQGRGLGGILFNRLVDIGRKQGILRFEAFVLTENAAMLRVFHRSGLKMTTSTDRGLVTVSMAL